MKKKVNRKAIHIAIVAPAFKPRTEILENLESFTIGFEKKHNVKFHIPKDLIQDHPLNSNTINQRVKHLTRFIKDPKIDIIWCLRGGYGSIQLLSELNKIKKPKKEKILIGLSDITSLKALMIEKWGWTTFHASHLDRIIDGSNPNEITNALLYILNRKLHNNCFNIDKTLENLPIVNPVISKKINEIQFNQLQALNQAAVKVKKINARMVGGNLITLCSHIGTDFEFNLKNSFLFFEEIGERAYKIDRCLRQLMLSKSFKLCKGVFIGQMTSCLESDGTDKTEWLFKDWAKDLKIPVFSGVPTGHDKFQWPLPLGNSATVFKNIDDQFNLKVEY